MPGIAGYRRMRRDPGSDSLARELRVSGARRLEHVLPVLLVEGVQPRPRAARIELDALERG